MTRLDAVGDAELVGELAAELRAAAAEGRAISRPGETRAGRRIWLKGSRLAGRARLRHALRERLGRPLPRLAELANLAWLRAHGFRAPRPFAAGALRSGGAAVYQFLATERIDEGVTVEAFLADAAPAARRELVGALAREVARLHAAGFVHRDLYPRNLLVCPARSLAEVWFLDAWRGGARRQLRGPAWDHACFLHDARLSPEERALWIDVALDARSLGAVRRALAAVARRTGTPGRCAPEELDAFATG